ncbi:MAG: hypothetical protein WC670_05955 [Pseudolabrys sp.]|jgi:hypothetical protein
MFRIATFAAGLTAVAAFGVASMPAAHAAEGRYCLIQAHSGAKNCSYRTEAACVKNKGSPADFCERYGGTTTGSGRRHK